MATYIKQKNINITGLNNKKKNKKIDEKWKFTEKPMTYIKYKATKCVGNIQSLIYGG